MHLKKRIKYNDIIRVLMIMLFCSFTIFVTYSWGRYIMLACVVGIFACNVMQNGLKYKLVVGRFVITVALFALYTVASAAWAEAASDALSKGKTLFELLLMVVVLYNCYYGRENGVKDVLWAIKWSSLVVVIYSILFYGIDNLIMMAQAEEQMDNSYANINTIGMLAAVGTLIQVGEILENKKLNVSVIFCIPSVFLLAMTQSRKGFVVLLVGSILVLLMKNMQSKDFVKKATRICLSVVLGVGILYLILSLPIFSGLMERMDGLIASFTGIGKVDNSTRVRNEMIVIGWEQFLKTPILGMGMGNPHLLSAAKLGKDAYLHNNFIELLAGGGIFGFTIYYSMYVYLFVDFWRYRKHKNKEYIICFVMMVVLLAMDYGMVSYYNKSRYIYLMLYFLEVKQLKSHAKTVSLRGEV